MGLRPSSQEKIYRNYWEDIEKFARDESKNSTKVSDYIRDYLTITNKKIPNKNKVYQEFKLKYPISTTLEDVEKNLKPIKKFAKYYHKLVNPIHEPDQEIRLQLEYINRLEINVAYPFLLRVYDDYSSRVISQKIFIDVLELIQSFTWRRFICGLPTSSLNKIFMRLYENVNQENYLTSIQAALVNKKGSQKFPRDNEVKNALREKDMYNGIKPKNRSYCLERLENYQNKEPVKIEENNGITIEHIFPQEPDPQWEKELGEEDFNFIKDNYLNTIANLTLSGNNSSFGNQTFLSKRDMNLDGKEQGYKYSRFWLNRYLSEVDKWGKAEIEERLKIVTERFLQVWLFPEINTQEIDYNEVNIFDAEEPTGKKLEYAILFDKKIEISEVSQLYLEVMKTLFELQPVTFFTTDLKEKLNITKDSSECRKPVAINETYFIEANPDSKGKFERIKKALTTFGCEDELIIKYQD